MTIILRGTVLLTAMVFIAISASVNALFLSSFGRSAMETGLLAGISIAGDVVKAVLPVVLMRAILMRFWGQAVLAAAMLMVVVVMSLASGLGFAAMTRSATAVAQNGSDAALAVRTAALTEIDARLAALPASRPRLVVDAELAAAQLERNWKLTKSCTDVMGPAAREYCGRVIAIRSELAASIRRDDLEAERRTLRAAIAELRAKGAGTDADPQAAALATLIGANDKASRVLLTGALAVVLEFGSIALILLAAGPALQERREPASEPEPERAEIAVPASVDRTHWHRNRARAPLLFDREAAP